jgi:TolB protein
MRQILICMAAAALAYTGCQTAPPEPAEPEGEPPVTQITMGRAGEDRDPEVSPDGAKLYYASSSFGAEFDLYVKDIGATAATRLTTMAGNKRFPRLNPANPRILAFAADTRGEWDIWVMDLQSGRADVVSLPGLHDIHPSWSPDGRHLVYCSAEDFGDGTWTLRVRDFETGKTHVLEEIDGLLPEWAPRGNRIVFQRMRRRDAWYSSLWTLEFDGGAAKSLTTIFSSDDWAAINPSWSPDGRRVVFATVGKSPARAGVFNEADDLWTIDADGAHATRLTTARAADWLPTWAPDGRIYFVSNRTGPGRIWSLVPHIPEIP